MLIGASEHEEATPLDLVVKYMCNRGWEIGLIKIQESSSLSKVLVIQWGIQKLISFKVKDKVLHLGFTTPTKEAQHLMGLFGIWMQSFPEVLCLPIYQVIQKGASFR